MAAARQTCRHDYGLTAALVVALLPTWELRASAEEATRIVRVGVLASAEQRPIQSFTERLRELGWIVGKNVRYDYRWAEANDTRWAARAAELAAIPIRPIVRSTSQWTASSVWRLWPG
jgi:hypothetical protein